MSIISLEEFTYFNAVIAEKSDTRVTEIAMNSFRYFVLSCTKSISIAEISGRIIGISIKL